VQTLTVQLGTIGQQLTATGDIIADARVEVFPKIEGYLQELPVEEGDLVHAGQVIARINDTELQAAVARASAEVDALRAEWAQMQAGALPEEIAQAEDRVQHTRAELANAEGVLERTRSMVGRGLQPAQELEDVTRRVAQARAMHNTAQKQLQLQREGARPEERQALQARLRAAQAGQRIAATALHNTVITAPMDGVISHRHVDPGAYMTNTNSPIVTIVAMQTVKIRVPISERDLGKVRPGLRASIRVDTYPGEVFNGTVQRISPTIDPTSRSGEVEISIANPDYRLKPGMFANVTLLLEQRQDVVVVPRDVVRRDGDNAAVFVVQDSVAHLRPVTTGLQNDTQVEILAGLTPGTDIVLVGHQGLKDKHPVKIIEKEAGS
jgi:multidrug efflux pump subunit AcrA (membrane-fusion protein)